MIRLQIRYKRSEVDENEYWGRCYVSGRGK